MNVTPYLDFNGRASDALEFYKKALGAEVVSLMRYRDNPDMCGSHPGFEDKVLHSSFKIGSTELMCSDGRCTGSGPIAFSGTSLALGTADGAESEKYFAALSDGGSVMLPLQKTFFSPAFGVVTDKFGVTWMVVAAHG